ncbi:MAG TPA: glutamate--tRNA ligase [bacterium (Candidatus Stahlbacteria)]|nr:glutamate--tRNA ligase [Candidatus Stahlbacteria bacterium]
MDQPRLRIAPSPTGFLHVGTARTALYNWLFARGRGGKFLLRVEDTDVQRSDEKMTAIIMESLKWLGLTWDEEPVFQSKRLHLYRKYAEQLVKKRACYYCYCTKEELERRRKLTIKEGKAWKYDRKCLNAPERKQPRVIRFFIPEGEVSFYDEIHGLLKRDAKDIDDFIIMRADGIPTYNFACCIDDHHMGITHVIRGEDHISNTHKQILIYKALGWEPPKFAHLPLILGPDKSRLSKRHGAVPVLDYRDKGILPDALVNFIALLGWSPGRDREILNRDELIKLFSLDRISKSGAVFDMNKLEWMNGEYIRRMDDEQLYHEILPFIKKKTTYIEKSYLLRVIPLLKDRMRLLTDFWDLGYYFFEQPKDYDRVGIEKYFSDPEASKRLSLLKERFSQLTKFDLENIELSVRSLAKELNIKAGKLIHTTRLALTGKTVGPSLFHIVEVLGKEEVISRLNKAIEFVRMGKSLTNMALCDKVIENEPSD